MAQYKNIRYEEAKAAIISDPYQTGTATSSGSNRLLDISTGNAFDIGVAGANILYLNNVTSPIDLTVKVAATQGVVGGYNLDANATVDTTEVFSYSWSTNPVTPLNGAGGLSFSPDGTKMFVSCIGTNMNMIGQFSLSTAWDPSTANTSPDYEYGYGSDYLQGFGGHFWNKGGKTVTQFLSSNQSSVSWRPVHMTTPYDLSTYTTTSQSLTSNRPSTQGATNAKVITSHIIDDPDSENDWWFYVDQSANLKRISYASSGATEQTSTVNSVFGLSEAPISLYVSPDGTILTALFASTMKARSVIMSTPFDLTSAGTPTEYNLNGDIQTTNSSTNWFADLASNDDGSIIFALRMYKGTFKIYEITPDTTITPPSLSFNSNHTPISGSANISLSHNSNAVFKIKSLTSDASEVTVLQAATGGGGSNPVTIWKSAPVTNSTYGAYAAHGQGIAADKVWVEMTCTTANGGYAVGDIIYKYQAQYSTAAQLTMYSDATDIGYRQDQIDAIMDSAYGPDTNSGSYARLAESSWEIRICGAWYDSSVVTQAT